MVDARNVSMLSLDITVYNGIASRGGATAGADYSRPQGLALIPREPRPWAFGPLGKGAGPRKTRVRTLPDAALAGGRYGFGCGLDEPGHVTGVGDHRDVAGRNLDGGGAHAGGELPLGLRRQGLVVGGDQVPGRPCFPGRDAHHVRERGHGQRLLY